MSQRLRRNNCRQGEEIVDAEQRALLRSRVGLALEVLALRQQVAVLKRKHPRPPLKAYDRLFWIALRRLWPGWKQVLVIVKPETVVGWHRAAFRRYWRWRSRRRPGRPRIADELRTLIHRLAQENPGWGAPKIHGELLELGFEICERTVARHLRRVRRRGDPAKNWLTFLENHREVIVALDFFTVPTLTFQLLYCLFVIHHGRRKILHFNVTRHPTAEWTLQQLREAFPDAVGCRYVILDHDSKFDRGVTDFLKSTGLKVKRTGERKRAIVFRRDERPFSCKRRASVEARGWWWGGLQSARDFSPARQVLAFAEFAFQVRDDFLFALGVQIPLEPPERDSNHVAMM
jgi:hypothetical protein